MDLYHSSFLGRKKTKCHMFMLIKVLFHLTVQMLLLWLLAHLKGFPHTKWTLTLIFLVMPHVSTGISFIVNIATLY